MLLADEPTGNLDSRTTMEILAMLQQLNRDDGITIIIVTHDPVVASHARRNIRLRDGLVESDTVSQPKVAVAPPPVPEIAGAHA